MTLAYVDTSCLVAIAFDETGATRLATRLQRFDRLFASNLLEAELRSTLTREGVTGREIPMLSWLTWVYPNRPLTAELTRIAALGYLKGADLWHLANALFLAPDAKQLAFLTTLQPVVMAFQSAWCAPEKLSSPRRAFSSGWRRSRAGLVTAA